MIERILVLWKVDAGVMKGIPNPLNKGGQYV